MLILVGNLAVLGSLMMVMTVLPIYLQDQGISATYLGVIVSLFNFSGMAIRLLVGREMDRRGRRVILLVALAAFAAGNLTYAWASTPDSLIVLRVIHGLAWGAVNTAITVVVIDSLPLSRRGEGVNIYAISAGLPTAFMPWFALLLLEWLSFDAVFFVAFMLPLIALAIMWRSVSGASELAPGPPPVLFDRSTLTPGLVALHIGATYGAVTTLIPLHLQELGSVGTGLFFLVFTSAVTLSRFFLRRVYDRYGAQPLMVFSLPVAGVGLWLMSLDTVTTFIIASAFCYGAGIGISKPTVQTWCVDLAPASRKATSNATFYTGFDFGVAVGAIAFSGVAGGFGYEVMFRSVSLAPLLALGLYLAAVVRARPARIH